MTDADMKLNVCLSPSNQGRDEKIGDTHFSDKISINNSGKKSL